MKKLIEIINNNKRFIVLRSIKNIIHGSFDEIYDLDPSITSKFRPGPVTFCDVERYRETLYSRKIIENFILIFCNSNNM